jgi:hypothetical protein
MVQHYTLDTVEVSEWCNKCRKMTMHVVADRRLQYCIPCWQASKEASDAEKAKPEPEQGSLF